MSSDSEEDNKKDWSWDSDEFFKDWPLEARLRKQGVTWGEEYQRNNPPEVVYGDPMPDAICQRPEKESSTQTTQGKGKGKGKGKSSKSKVVMSDVEEDAFQMSSDIIHRPSLQKDSSPEVFPVQLSPEILIPASLDQDKEDTGEETFCLQFIFNHSEYVD